MHFGKVAQRRLGAHCRPFGTCHADGSRHVRHGHPVWMQVFIGAAIPRFLCSLRGFEQPPFHAAKVRNASSMGSHSETSRLHAIRLISLRVPQTFLLDWPRMTVTPVWTRTLFPTSLRQTNRRWPSTRQLPGCRPHRRKPRWRFPEARTKDNFLYHSLLCLARPREASRDQESADMWHH